MASTHFGRYIPELAPYILTDMKGVDGWVQAIEMF